MSENGKKRCFVVQGFGVKTDFRTGRQLNLDDSFEIIQEAITDAGMECIRADKVMHSGSIDVEMWEEILNADLVVADVSTSNWNAAYELGVRHALRPHSTIVVAEDQFEFAFDINHIAIHTYTHGGKELGRREAVRFRAHLQKLIETKMEEADRRADSPIFLSLPGLKAPVRGAAPEPLDSPATSDAAPAPSETWDELRDQARQAIERGDWEMARSLLDTAHQIVPREHYITQQLSLATRKAKQPQSDPPTAAENAAYREALEASIAILEPLGPAASADPETLGLWSASHKELWFLDRDRQHLDEAIRASEKGFLLRNDSYNGINLAFLLNVRAAEPEVYEGEAIADFVHARQVRRRVARICTQQLEEMAVVDRLLSDAEKEAAYWVLATLQETAEGLGDAEGAAKWKAEAAQLQLQDWMARSTEQQLARLRALLAASPLDRTTPSVDNDGAALAAAHAKLAAVKVNLADVQAKLAAAEAQAQQARATAARAATVVPDAPRDVQFSLLAGDVEIEVSGSSVEATIRRRPAR